jgi:hypothetical protein
LAQMVAASWIDCSRVLAISCSLVGVCLAVCVKTYTTEK